MLCSQCVVAIGWQFVLFPKVLAGVTWLGQRLLGVPL